MLKRLTLAVVGYGRMGRIHASSITAHPTTSLKYVSSRNLDKLSQTLAQLKPPDDAFAEIHPMIPCSFEDVLADSSVDGIAISSTSQSHLHLIERAAAAKKAVFVEKPLAMSVEETKAAIQACEQNQVPLFTAYQRKFDPAFQHLYRQIADGAVGDVHIIRLISRDHPPPCTDLLGAFGGSFFSDFSVHDIDMALHLARAGALGHVTEVHARASSFLDNYRDAGMDDTAVILLRFASGAQAVLENSRRTTYGYDIRGEVLGSEGMLTLSNPLEHDIQLANLGGVRSARLHHSFPERFQHAFRAEMDSWLADVAHWRNVGTVRRNTLSVPSSNVEVMRVVELADASRKQQASRPASSLASNGSSLVDRTSTKRKTVNVCVLGAGRMGQRRLDALARLGTDVNVMYIADESLLAAMTGVDLLGEHHGRHIVTPQQCLDVIENDPSIHAVFICSTTSTHADLVDHAVKHRKHVFVEKPLAPSSTDTADLIQEAGDYQVALYCGFQRRCDDSFSKFIRDFQHTTDVPELVRITSRDSSVHNSLSFLLSSGSYTWDSLIHDIDMACYIADQAPCEVFAQGSSFIPELAASGQHDCMVAVLYFPSGCIAVLDNHRRAMYGYDQRMEIHSAAGWFLAENVPQSQTRRADAEGLWQDRPLDDGMARYADAFRAETTQFIEYLRGERDQLASQPHHYVTIARVCEAMEKSLASGKPELL